MRTPIKTGPLQIIGLEGEVRSIIGDNAGNAPVKVVGEIVDRAFDNMPNPLLKSFCNRGHECHSCPAYKENGSC